MIDHIGFPVSDYARSKAFYLKALAPLDYTLVMEVTQEQTGHDPAAGLAPMASLISGSAARADWISRCTSPFSPRIAQPWMRSTRQPSRPAAATMAPPEFARIIIRIITARSCSIPMATTSKPFATRRRNALPGSIIRMAGNFTAPSSLSPDADRTAGNTARDAGTSDRAAAGGAARESASGSATAGARTGSSATTAGVAWKDAGRAAGARAEWSPHT
jgi:hypothetical protein